MWVKSHSSAHTKPARKEQNYVAAAASSEISRKTQAGSRSPTDKPGRGWAAATSSNNCATAAKQRPSESVYAAEASRSSCAAGAKQEPSRSSDAAAAAAEQVTPGAVLQARGGDCQVSCCAPAIRPQSGQDNSPPPVDLKAGAQAQARGGR